MRSQNSFAPQQQMDIRIQAHIRTHIFICDVEVYNILRRKTQMQKKPKLPIHKVLNAISVQIYR